MIDCVSGQQEPKMTGQTSDQLHRFFKFAMGKDQQGPFDVIPSESEGQQLGATHGP